MYVTRGSLSPLSKSCFSVTDKISLKFHTCVKWDIKLFVSSRNIHLFKPRVRNLSLPPVISKMPLYNPPPACHRLWMVYGLSLSRVSLPTCQPSLHRAIDCLVGWPPMEKRRGKIMPAFQTFSKAYWMWSANFNFDFPAVIRRVRYR